MDFRVYLLTQKTIQLGAVASLMWPNNKNAKVYLSMKLNGYRKWTEKDNQLAAKALAEIAQQITNLQG